MSGPKVDYAELRRQEMERLASARRRRLSIADNIPHLQDILNKYNSYEWNPDTISEYKIQESKKIEENENEIKRVSSNSFRLDFRRCY